MQILAIEKEQPDATPEQFASLSKAEAQRAWGFYQAGVFRQLYFRADEHSAVIMLECANLTEAEAILQELPLVHAGLIRFELIPLAAYPGFARLFC
jgi:hypothetical protein